MYIFLIMKKDLLKSIIGDFHVEPLPELFDKDIEVPLTSIIYLWQVYCFINSMRDRNNQGLTTPSASRGITLMCFVSVVVACAGKAIVKFEDKK